MPSLAPADQVDRLLGELDEVEPVSYDLGTPDLPEVDAVRQLVALGPAIVPLLLARMQGEGNVPAKKRAAYIALALGRLGDARALQPLLDLRARYEQRQDKDEWDYAVIGQCNLAIQKLR